MEDECNQSDLCEREAEFVFDDGVYCRNHRLYHIVEEMRHADNHQYGEYCAFRVCRFAFAGGYDFADFHSVDMIMYPVYLQCKGTNKTRHIATAVLSEMDVQGVFYFFEDFFAEYQ